MRIGQTWMGLVAQVPCVICTRQGIAGSPSIVHHMKHGTGASDRARDVLTIALCPGHHVGPEGVHTLKERGLRLRYNCSEIDLLADTIEGVVTVLSRRVTGFGR
jgi:hypothetical protein